MKKISLALVLMLLTSGIIAQEEAIKQKFIEETRIEAPVFKGNLITEAAPQQSLNQYLQQQLSYLSNYDFISDEGIVSVEFTVESDGQVSNVFVTNSVNKLLDKAVLEAIEKSSKLWLAGKVNSIPNAMAKTVFVKFDIPGNVSHNQMAIDYMTKAVRQVYAIENLQHLPLAMDKQTRKTSRKARFAESYLSKAERFKPNDLSITFWQAKVYELQGRNELMQQQLNKYLELVYYQQYEEDLLNQHDMAVITLK
jgi:TonB family protein